MNALRFVLLSSFAALCTALAAHIAIDALGDILLAHDTYDALDHRSRSIIATSVLAVLFACASLFVRHAFVRARGDDRTLCASLADLVPKSALAFFAAVSACALPALVAMEALDARLDGAAISGLGDLFGGSFALGIGTTLACAFAVCLVVARALRAATALCDAIVRIVAVVFGRRAARAGVVCDRRFRRSAGLCRGASHGRRLVGRAPPPTLSPAT